MDRHFTTEAEIFLRFEQMFAQIPSLLLESQDLVAQPQLDLSIQSFHWRMQRSEPCRLACATAMRQRESAGSDDKHHVPPMCSESHIPDTASLARAALEVGAAARAGLLVGTESGLSG